MKKKILICSSSYRSLLNFRGKLIEEFINNGLDVIISTPKIEEESYRAKLNDLGVKIYENELIRNKYSMFSDFDYVKRLYQIIKQEKPDITFTYTFKPIFYGSVIAKLLGVKSINCMLTGLGYNFISDSFMSKMITRVFKFSLSCNNEIIFQNEDDLAFLTKKNIINKKKSSTNVVNGSGVDLSHYFTSDVDLNKIKFLMIGRLLKAKGIKEYFEAASIIKEKYSEATFELVGDYEKNSVDIIDEELYQKILSGDVINYIGRVSDVRSYIENSSIVVLPSYREGTPRSILEAMSMGRAVLTTDTPGCRQTICKEKGKENGFLVPIKDSKVLAEKMEFYIQNTDKIIEYGLNGRKYVEEKYDVRKVNKHMLDILKIK